LTSLFTHTGLHTTHTKWCIIRAPLVLGRATGNTDTRDSPRPGLGGSHHLPLYSILWTSPRAHIQMAFLSRDSRMGIPKSRQPGLPGLWSPITLRADLRSKCGLKQSCSSHRELSNGMWHVICNQVNRVDSRLFLVGNQTGNSTLGPLLSAITCVSDVQMSNVSPF